MIANVGLLPRFLNRSVYRPYTVNWNNSSRTYRQSAHEGL